MPAAAKLLAENNLSASAVAGTGKDGRVTKGDVLGAVASGAARPAAPAAAPAVAIPTGVTAPRCRRSPCLHPTWATAPSNVCP
jgi:2-oxoglutarate dehydrogenase E2 component (dihydrolipoamide succinyltransferase)